MISDENIIFKNLKQILMYLNEGKTEKATILLNATEPALKHKINGQEFSETLRDFINISSDNSAFINALADGNLDVNPPDDPLRKNYAIAQYKQIHSNLLHLTWQAQQIAKGDLGQKVSFLGEFSISFNKMIEALREKEVLVEKIKIQAKELKELNATKDKFFSIIAHDLRGPLGGFIGLAEMLADDSQPFTTDQRKDIILALSRSSRNIFSLLENLLEWARTQQGNTAFKPEINNLNKLITECVKILSETIRKKSIRIDIDIEENQEVFADRYMFQSVIRNLVSNAIKFTPVGGKVSVSANLTENNTTVITVKDTGIGMKADMVSNLFKLNVNSSRPGTEGEHSTGLGLMLCKEFVERHGGELWVESEEGKGSMFCFTIPGKNISKEINFGNKNILPDKELGHTKNLKILIAEDNENAELLIRIVVSPYCKKLLEAATGNKAVEVCRNNPDIDLILMDINMPELDGLEATRQIRQFNKDVIIIAQTAFGKYDSREKALEAGCDDFISKPIEIIILLDMIKKYFKL
jgi:signal transduction histidine kinase/CheY-like chemotaxis protein